MQSLIQFLESLPKSQYDALMSEAWAEAQRVVKGGYEPRGNIRELFTANGGEIVLSGPAGTGKSRGCFEYLHQQAMRWPNARILLVRKTRASLNNTGLVTYEKEVLGDGHPVLADGKTKKGRDEYVYSNGAVIVVGGMDKDTKIMSSQYDLIYVQEATELTIDDWESLTTRKRNGIIPEPLLIGDVNPQSPKHFLHQRWQAGSLKMVFTQHEDNPVLYDAHAKKWTARGDQYLKILDALTGVRKERLRYGRWVAAEGVVYSIDYAVHFVDQFEIPKNWRRVCSVDFGFHNPFVCAWWAISPDGDVYLYRYIYKTNRLLEDHLRMIQEINKERGENIELYICDHDSQEFEMMRARGFNVVKAYKDITTGIQAVQARLKIDPVTKRPRMFFVRDSLVERDDDLEELKKVCTLEGELDSYSWPKSDAKIVKEAPIKENDHMADTIRYFAAWIDNIGKPNQGSVIITPGVVLNHPMQRKPGQMTNQKRQLPPAIGRR